VAVEQVPFPDTLPLSRQVLRDAANCNEDVDAEYTQFKAQLVTQKFAKLSKLGYSVGCGTVDLLRMLSVEGTSSNARFFEIRKLLSESIDHLPSFFSHLNE